MRSNCTKELPPSAPAPPPKPAAVASSSVLRSVPRSRACSTVSVAAAGASTALSCAVGRWSDSATFSSKRSSWLGATASTRPSSIKSST
nr:hypothetical protein [Rhodoferax sp.]